MFEADMGLCYIIKKEAAKMAEYILMHKNIPVIKMELTEADGITKILDLYAPEHLPIGIPVKKNTVDKKALNM